VHVSQGEPRLERKRASSLKALPSQAAHAPHGARKRPHRALLRSMFRAARAEAASLLGGDAPAVARMALRLFRAARRELGANGPSAITALWSWAMLAACSQTLTMQAARESLASDRGLQLVERAAKLQGAAGRAWTAAAVAAGLVPSQPAAEPAPAPWLERDDGGEP
jgi:hypothetical protein